MRLTVGAKLGIFDGTEVGLVGAFVLGFADGNLVGNNVGLMLLQEESSIRLI